MSQDQTPGPTDEAAMWSARMLRSDASRYQPQFEAWLQADDAHRRAYARLSQNYERSRVLADSRLFVPEQSLRPRKKWIAPISLRVGAVVAGLAAAGIMLLSLSAVFTTLLQSGGRPTPSETAGQVASVRHAYPLTSPTGGIRTMRLPDGSKVILDAGASLTVAYDQSRRVLTLIRGRARFEVAHEARPFVVAAGAGDITAHGTIFDVEITDGGRVQVALIRGAIGVRVRDKSTNAWSLRELTPHQKTDFDPAGFITPVQPLAAQAKDWPSGVVDVDAMPLAELLRDANRYTTAPIEIAQPDLASLHVSGRFQVDRPDLLVQNLADLFDLTVDRSQKGRILLRKNIQAGAKPA